MEDHVKKDLLWALLFFAAVFILWLVTGGPEKNPEEKGPFLKSPVEKVSEEIKTPINP